MLQLQFGSTVFSRSSPAVTVISAQFLCATSPFSLILLTDLRGRVFVLQRSRTLKMLLKCLRQQDIWQCIILNSIWSATCWSCSRSCVRRRPVLDNRLGLAQSARSDGMRIRVGRATVANELNRFSCFLVYFTSTKIIVAWRLSTPESFLPACNSLLYQMPFSRVIC